jgi:hypothetical protein
MAATDIFGTLILVHKTAFNFSMPVVEEMGTDMIIIGLAEHLVFFMVEMRDGG